MNTYDVYPKGYDIIVTSYQTTNEEPVDIVGYSTDDFDHIKREVGAPHVPESGPYEWCIDVGPFFDRFGGAKMAVLKSKDDTIVAIRSDASVRKWIDLKRPDVIASVRAIAQIIPEVTDEIADYVLNTPVSEIENFNLRLTMKNAKNYEVV